MISTLQKILDKQGVGLLSGSIHSGAWEGVAWMSYTEDSPGQFSLSWCVIVSMLSLHRDDLNNSQASQRLCGRLGLCIRESKMGMPT